MWYDTEELQTDWSKPTRRPRWVIPVAIIAIIALLLTAVWAVGGFDARRGRLPLLEAGTTYQTGQLQVTFTYAVAKASSLGKGTSVKVYGTCRNISDTPTHVSNDNAYAAKMGGSDDMVLPTLLTFEGPTFNTVTKLNPGLDPVLCALTFDYESAIKVSDHFILAIYDMDWGDHTVTKSGEESWQVRSTGVRLVIPLRVQASS